MLHEMLLALSGHPSPLFNDTSPAAQPRDARSLEGFALVSPSERALLRSIGQLSELHRRLRQHIGEIALHHESTMCRAVATSIQQKHLARFQDKILAVEGKILTKDSSLVGAYDIVPLAGVVGEFDDWHRRMAWYWDIMCFMQPVNAGSAGSDDCSGAALIDKLRVEQQTGFPDIEQAAIELSTVAERAWLRQLAPWILYGKLPAFGADDFFIRSITSEKDEGVHFSKKKGLLPKFVTTATASSILFIGKSLHQVQRYGRQVRTSKSNHSAPPMSEREVASAHLDLLSDLSLPVVSGQLARNITAIRLSLSQNILQSLLPMEMTIELLLCLKQFFLMGRSEFAVALIQQAESRVQARQQSMGRLLQQDPVKALQGWTIKDAEFHQTLSQTWKVLASQQDDDAEDNVFDFARRHISLSVPRDHRSRPSTADSVNDAAMNLSSVAFNDLLFPSAALLDLDIKPPLDLFVSPREIETYSIINAYLLSLRRARLRLSDLWRRTPARRDHPAPRQGSMERTGSTMADRERLSKRRTAARKMWATCSAAMFLLTESSAYFEGEVIGESWRHFEQWVMSPLTGDDSEVSQLQSSTHKPHTTAQKDPETLASGHRAFLASLTYALLLNDTPYTRELRSLLGNVDNLIAFFGRLLDIQQKLDVEQDAGGSTEYTTLEEKRIALELDRARKKVDSDLKSVVNRLRQLDHERIGAAGNRTTGVMDSGFEPRKGGGIDRLLMKLEFGRMVEDGFDIV